MTIEAKMKEIINAREPVRTEIWDRDRAIAHYKAANEPFKLELIDRIPEGEPLVERVLDEIVRRNPARGGPDPKPRGAPGSAAAGAPPSTADSKAGSATTTSPSSSPFVSTGRPT